MQANYLVKTVGIQPKAVYSLRRKMSVQEFEEAFGGLCAGLEKNRLKPAGPFLSVYHDEEFKRIKYCEEMLGQLNRFFEKNTDRQGTEAYYDVTTYAFESTRWGELRMFGFSKDHKNNEVQVVMGLLLDNNGIED